MSIQELTRVVPPPEKPINAGSHLEWDAIQASLGLELPSDLYDLSRTYGSGEFAFFIIFNPLSRHYLTDIADLLATYRSLQSIHGQRSIPYAIYPEMPGLLPCGSTLDGGMIFYFTYGNPDSWPLVLLGHVYEWQQINLSLTTFLAQSCSGKLDCIFWNDEWREENLKNVVFLPREFD